VIWDTLFIKLSICLLNGIVVINTQYKQIELPYCVCSEKWADMQMRSLSSLFSLTHLLLKSNVVLGVVLL
jgi:hypothetical protein